MRKSHHGKSHDLTSVYPDIGPHIHDPLRLTASRPVEADDSAHTAAQTGHNTSVNPLWMITAGLAAFLILLVAVW